MKTLTNRIVLFAASAVVLGTMAYGQSPVVKADIPFAFHTVNAKLPAGEYIVTRNQASAGGNITVLRNKTSNHSVVALGSPAEYRKSGAPALTFQCGTDGCALVALRTSEGTVSYYVNRNKSHDKEIAVITVPLRVVNGD